MAKRQTEELRNDDKFSLAINSYISLINKRVSKLQFESMSDYCDALSESMFKYDIEMYPKCVKDTNNLAKEYYAFKKKTIEEVLLQKKNFPKNADAADKTTSVLRQFKVCDVIVQDILKFANGKIDVKIKDVINKKTITINLYDLAIEDKQSRTLKKLGKGALGLASILSGSVLPALIPEGISKLTKELKNFKQNSLKGKLKTGGALALGGLGMLTGTGLGVMGASWLKEKANADLQAKKNHEEFTKNFKEKLLRNKQEFKLGNSGNRGTSSGRNVATSTDSGVLFEVLEALHLNTSKKYDSVKRKYTNFKAAKGGIFDLKGGANSRLGKNLQVNEQGQEQAIVLPAKKSPLDILIQKVTETNEILYEQLDEQQDQARLAALARKDKQKESSSSIFKPVTTPTASAEKGGILDDLIMMKMMERGLTVLKGMVPAIVAVAIPVLGALAVGGAVFGLSMLAKNLWDTSDMGKEHAKKQDAERKKADARIATERAANPNWKEDAIIAANSGPYAEMATGGNIIVGEAGAETLRVTPKDNKDFPSGSTKNPFYVVQDDRKRKRNPDDLKLAALQTKAFSAMQMNNNTETEEPTFMDKVSSIWGSDASIGTKFAETGQQAWGAAKGVVKSLGKGFNFVKDSIFGASNATGVDAGTMTKFAQIESGFNPNAKAGTSSATGLYQFTKGTWNDMISKYGKKHGLDKSANPSDPNANALMAGEYINENKKALQAAGIPATDGALYLTHFLGGVGGVKLLKSNANSSAARLFPDAAKANPSVFYDGNREKTVGEIIGWADKKMNIDVSKIYATASAKQPTTAPIDNSTSIGQRNVKEGSVKNIKHNTRGAGEGSRLKTMEVGFDAQMQASHAQGTQQAINNISVGGGNNTPIPPANITTGDNMSFATRLAKSY